MNWSAFVWFNYSLASRSLGSWFKCKKISFVLEKITKDFHDFQDAILSIKENDKMKELIELERFWFIYLQSCFPGTRSNSWSQVKKTAFHREVKTFMTFRVWQHLLRRHFGMRNWKHSLNWSGHSWCNYRFTSRALGGFEKGKNN